MEESLGDGYSDYKRKKPNNPAKRFDYQPAYLDSNRRKILPTTAFRNAAPTSLVLKRVAFPLPAPLLPHASEHRPSHSSLLQPALGAGLSTLPPAAGALHAAAPGRPCPPCCCFARPRPTPPSRLRLLPLSGLPAFRERPDWSSLPAACRALQCPPANCVRPASMLRARPSRQEQA